MEVIQHKLLELQLSGVEPAAGIVIAIRAALRTLPLLMLRSKAFDTTTYSAEPFGFWPDDAKKRHLHSLLSAHSLNIFLVCEDALFSPTALEAEGLLKRSLKFIAESIRDAELACRTIEENMESFPDPRDVAHLSSNLLVCKVLGSVRSIIFSLYKLNSQRLSVTTAAEHTQILSNHIKILAAKVIATLADSTNEGKKLVAKNFQDQGEGLLTAAAIDAAHLAKRFGRYSDLVSELALSFDNDINLINFSDAAKVASDAFNSVARAAQSIDAAAYVAAFSEALVAAERYELARIAILPFYAKIEWDLFVDVDRSKYELIRFIYDEGMVASVIDPLISSAEEVIATFSSIAEGIGNSDVRSVLRKFESARTEFESRFMDSACIFDEVKNAIADFFAALTSQENEQNKKLHSVDDQEKLEKDIRSHVLQAVTSSKEASGADVAAYSTYSTCDINTIFRQSLLTDIELVKKYPRQELLVQQLWLLAEPDTEAEQQVYLFGENTWQHMWQTFKREALIVDPGLDAWLDWYDDLFAGNSFDIKTLNDLLESRLSQ